MLWPSLRPQCKRRFPLRVLREATAWPLPDCVSLRSFSVLVCIVATAHPASDQTTRARARDPPAPLVRCALLAIARHLNDLSFARRRRSPRLRDIDMVLVDLRWRTPQSVPASERAAAPPSSRTPNVAFQGRSANGVFVPRVLQARVFRCPPSCWGCHRRWFRPALRPFSAGAEPGAICSSRRRPQGEAEHSFFKVKAQTFFFGTTCLTRNGLVRPGFHWVRRRWFCALCPARLR